MPMIFQTPIVDSFTDTINHGWGVLIGVGKLGDVITSSSEDAIAS